MWWKSGRKGRLQIHQLISTMKRCPLQLQSDGLWVEEAFCQHPQHSRLTSTQEETLCIRFNSLGKVLLTFCHLPFQSHLSKSLYKCTMYIKLEKKKEYFQSHLTGKERRDGGRKQANHRPGRRSASQPEGRLHDETENNVQTSSF